MGKASIASVIIRAGLLECCTEGMQEARCLQSTTDTKKADASCDIGGRSSYASTLLSRQESSRRALHAAKLLRRQESGS
jgi:hypothetical protein